MDPDLADRDVEDLHVIDRCVGQAVRTEALRTISPRLGAG
jgi:hypothetical protein